MSDTNGLPPRVKPPFLRRVRIRGYKSIAFCDVTLEPLTVLVGKNGSGKSNFLDALAFLRDVFMVGVGEAVRAHGGRDSIFCRSTAGEPVVIEAALGGSTWDATARIDVEAGALPGAVALTREELFVSPGPGPLGGSSARDGLRSMRFYNFAPQAIRKLAKPLPGYFLDKDGGNLASVIVGTKGIEPWAIDRIAGYLAVIAGTARRIDVARYGEYETVRFGVPTEDGGEHWFDAANMSDGALRATAALMAAFQRVVPIDPSVVAIEEPETSLHPAAMDVLVDALDEATGRTQILITTHSPDLLDNPTLKPENLRVVEMTGGRTVIASVDEASVEVVQRKLFTLGSLERLSQLEPNLDDLDRQEALEGQKASGS